MQKCLIQDSSEDFNKLISLRKLRSDRFVYEYDYESRIEQIEGTANYVELSALSQLNPRKAETGWEKLYEDIVNPDKYFPTRVITYYTGAAFIACLKKYSDTIRERTSLFKKQMNTKKALRCTFVTTYGVKENSYSDIVDNQVLLEDLFR